MTYRVTLKRPDALEMAVASAVACHIDDNEYPDEDAKEDARQNLTDEAWAAGVPFFRYGEYLTVEVDTVAKTCVVVPNGG